MSKKATAQTFGTSLDQDDFATTRSVLSEDCTYIIGEETLHGPIDIAKSYEDNMIAGRKKLDQLEWGECRIEELSPDEFYVHFTDYLTHQSKEYTHRCKQKVSVNDQNEIARIEHISDQEEQDRLDEFYRSVGLK
ncbi:MAG: hypothetical protein AB8B56_11985 [Crocinitomicaceae bacterium]